MLPFNGITFPPKIVNISYVFLEPTWMATGTKQELQRNCLAKITLSVSNWENIYTRINERGKIIPCQSRSANRLFLFQTSYGVGCPDGVT
jgi:hypothetical protein